ncbi:hypothetical protein KKI93_18170, partial [Xenorhabdus bovienii]|nr:hypothetical protein [Xenorhabdus bovienii]
RHFTSTNAITIPHVFTLIIREKQRDEYVTKWLDKNIALITYQSYEINKSGHPFNKALRSSIWQLSVSGTWQLRFHQGTIMAAQPLSNITL